jgi:hypothetical protein
LASSLGRKRKGRRRGAAESARLRRRAGEQGEEEKEGGRERLTGGARASVTAKEKKRERERRAGAGRLAGPASLAGPKGKEVRFCFFFFSFSNFFLKPLFFSNSNQTLSNFFSRIL